VVAPKLSKVLERSLNQVEKHYNSLTKSMATEISDLQNLLKIEKKNYSTAQLKYEKEVEKQEKD